jgi:hypothetical protein
MPKCNFGTRGAGRLSLQERLWTSAFRVGRIPSLLSAKAIRTLKYRRILRISFGSHATSKNFGSSIWKTMLPNFGTGLRAGGHDPSVIHGNGLNGHCPMVHRTDIAPTTSLIGEGIQMSPPITLFRGDAGCKDEGNYRYENERTFHGILIKLAPRSLARGVEAQLRHEWRNQCQFPPLLSPGPN